MSFKAIIIVYIVVSATFAFGRGRERPQFIIVGEGIAKPSVTTTLACQENPAGLADLAGVGLHLLGARTPATKEAEDVDWAGAALLFGGHNVGASVGGLSYLKKEGEVDNNTDILMGGFGFAVDSWGLAVGIDGRQVSGTSSRAIDLGLLFGTSGKTQLGIVAYGIEGDTRVFGFGIAHEIDAASFVLDVISGNSTTTLTPAVGVNVSVLQLALGYRHYSETAVQSGVLFGIGFNLGDSFSLQLQNERLQEYMLGLTFVF